MPQKKIEGLQAYRLKKYQGCRLEARFAREWAKRNEKGALISYLLDPMGSVRPPLPSERDQVVAATVIQWLGSHAGQLFLQDLGFVPKGVKTE